MSSCEDAVEQVKGILGEHFQNYTIIVQHDCGDLQYEMNNQLVGKALMRETLDILKQEQKWEDSEDVEVVWDDEEDDRWGDLEDEEN